MTETMALPSDKRLRRRRFNSSILTSADAGNSTESIEESDTSRNEETLSSVRRSTQGRQLRKTPRKNPRYFSDYVGYSDAKHKHAQSCGDQKITMLHVSSTAIEHTPPPKDIDYTCTCIVPNKDISNKETNLSSCQSDDTDDDNKDDLDNRCASDTDNTELLSDMNKSIKVISEIVKEESSSKELLRMHDDVQSFPETSVEGSLEDGNIDGFSTIYAVMENSNNDNSDSFEYGCSECDFKSQDMTEIFVHQKLHSVKEELDKMDGSEQVEDRHVCDKCGKTFCSTQSMKSHIRTIHEKSIHLCANCGKQFLSKRAMAEHMKQAHGSGGQYHCAICNRRFQRKVYYNSHMRRHLGYKPFKCNCCEKDFFWKHSLVSHQEKCGVDLDIIYARNEAKLQFICSICGQYFTRKGAYNSHMKRHNDPKIFQCGHCQKLYNWKHNLLLHMKKCGSNDTEADTEEFQCNLCSHKFKRKLYYDSHMRRHKGQKPFQCDRCEKRFYWKHGLSTHLMKCGKTEDELKAAEDSESRLVAEFPCHICGLLFSRESSLKVHVKGKHQSPQYKCDCGKAYAWPSALANHKKKCLRAAYPVIMEENALVWTEELI